MAQSSRTLEEQLNATMGFSDLTIVCQGVEFAAHRYIVCAYSPVLTAALTSNFSEATSRTVGIDFDLDSVKRFLEFLYTGDYHEIPDPALALITRVPAHNKNTEQSIVLAGSDDDQNATGGGSASVDLQLSDLTVDAVNKTTKSWICHCRMSSMADYYNVDRLSTISLAKLEESLRGEWRVDSFCALLLECLDEISNINTLRLLGNIAAEHYEALATSQIFEAGSPGERLAQFVLPSCLTKLNQTEALRKEATRRCADLEYELRIKESESAQHLKNLEECKSLLRDWSHCRNLNCEAEFKCFFDTRGPYNAPTYILRCSRCRCRHE